MQHSVVESLVVGEVEALLLQTVLHVPIDFRHEQEVRALRFDPADCFEPEFGAGRVELAAPRAREDFARDEHRHVAAHAVALRRDG